jgi:peptidyl-prolyl cis-trans isomerase SurA
MVPEFEEKMKNTPVGQTSKPFQTQFGWHIFK